MYQSYKIHLKYLGGSSLYRESHKFNPILGTETSKSPYTYENESESCSFMFNSLQPHGLYSLQNSPDQNTGVGSLSLLQGIFPTQGLIPDLPHCRQVLYQLSHKESPLIVMSFIKIYIYIYIVPFHSLLSATSRKLD